MPACPRCGASVAPVRQVVELPAPGGLVERRPSVTGWICENGHDLAVNEAVSSGQDRS